MIYLFYLAAAVAVICSLRALTHSNAVHALLYLIVSLMAVALVFFLLGAPFAAVLEVIVYAGAIMVLFVFVIMMLNVAQGDAALRRKWLHPSNWIGPGILAAVLLGELIYVLAGATLPFDQAAAVGPHAVGLQMFGPYLLGVEMASILLLSGLVGAYHLARQETLSGRPGGDG